MAEKLKKRCEVNPEYTWKVEDLYPTDEAFLEALEKFKAYPEKVAKLQGVFTTSANELLKYFKMTDELAYLIINLIGYAGRKSDVDTADSKYQGFMGGVMTTLVQYDSAAAFITPELIALSDDTLEKYYAECSELEKYRLAIDEARRMKAHTLSASEEEILALAGDMMASPEDIHGMFCDADIVFPEITDENGDKVRITHGNFIPFMESADRRVRQEAFKAMYSTCKQFRNTTASMLDAQTKSLLFTARARKYDTTLESALDGTNVDPQIYHNLIDSVHRNMDKMHRYVALRKKLLNVDELHMYDLYTPIVADAAMTVTFDEAKKTVLEALKPLGEDYLKVLSDAFDSRWIDIYENEGKRSGAYSMGTPTHPYVLLNYADTLDSMFTLIHEMGHAMHSYLSYENQPITYAEYKIFVAEVASTCNEALLMRYLLAKTTDKKERAYLINHFLEGFRTTLYRQTMFAEFELKINELTAQGEKLTADKLCEIYHDLNVLYYGPDMVVDELIDVEWARIPHFYYNYYVYQYATSYAAAVTISDRILKEGEPVVKDYLNFLSSGCTKPPVELLKGAGVDMSTSEPIDRALDVFSELIDEMEELLK